MSNRHWAGVAAAVALCTAGIVVAMLTAPVAVTVPLDDLAELVAAFLGAGACLLASRRHRDRARLGWLLVGVSAATWGTGQGIWTVYDLVIHRNPFPSPSDVGFVSAVPILLAGLFAMPVWPSAPAARLRAFTDGLLIAGGLLVVSWNTVLAAIVAAPADTALGQGLSLTYPIGDLVVLTVLAIMCSRAVAGTRAPLLMLIGGLALIAVSDSTFAYQQAQNSFGSGNVIDVGWIAGYLVVGLGALFSLNRPLRPASGAIPSWYALVLPYAPIPLVVGFAVQERLSQGRISLFTLSMALGVFLVVLLRQALSVQENLGLLRRLASNEVELHHRAEHDPLTNLLNRASFIRTVDELLTTRVVGGYSAIMFVDLDDFKHINDSLGHSFGDEAIVVVGRRLLTCTRADDLVARLGGDEFAIFLRDLPNVERLVSIAQRVIDALNEPFETSEMRASVAGTIGVAIAEPADDAAELLRRADIAMYAAKAQGKGLFGIFEPSMHIAMYAPLERRADLERAVEAGELTLHFQPIVTLPGRSVVGVEALLRWDHPQLGLLHPAEFLEDLERAGLMVRVGAWVASEACRQVMLMRRATGLDTLRAGINVTVSQLQDPGFLATVADALAGSGLPPSDLVVELTESGSIGDSEVVAMRLRQLRETGVHIAIDDFGSGYASFMYLRRLRVDALKIDKSFIDDLLAGGPASTLVEGMLRLGGTLGLATVAEGVETEEQHTALVRLSCRQAQGFLYAHPMPMEKFIARYGAAAGAVEVAVTA